MNFKNLIDDDSAVSPVIGVILMVAITVILAAVIGTFVLGLGDQVQSTTPQASFNFDSENIDGTHDDDDPDDKVTITHESGDSLTQSNINVKIGSTFIYEQGSAKNGGDGWESGDSISAGDQLVFQEDGSSEKFSGEETIRVIYDNPNTDSTSTLASQTYTFDETTSS